MNSRFYQENPCPMINWPERCLTISPRSLIPPCMDIGQIFSQEMAQGMAQVLNGLYDLDRAMFCFGLLYAFLYKPI